MGKKRRRELATAEAATADRHDFAGGYLGHDATYSVNVNERTALAVDVVYACVRTLADAVADARWGEWIGTDKQRDSALTRRPMASWTRRRWSWRVAATLALYNVQHIERRGIGAGGEALSLVPLVPGTLIRVGRQLYVNEGTAGMRKVADDRIVTIRRADWPSVTDAGGTVLSLARQVFAAAWAADAYRTDFWESGGAPQIILSTDQPLTETQADDASTQWTDKRRAHPGAPAVLGRGIKADALGADLASADGGASSDRMAQGIARYFGMPPWLVNVASAAGSMTYSNTEQAGLDLVRYTLRGYLGPIEDCVSDELPGDFYASDPRVVRLDVSHLTMGTMLERFQAYEIATGRRAWMDPGEVRAALQMPADAKYTLDPNGAPAPAMETIP